MTRVLYHLVSDAELNITRKQIDAANGELSRC